MKRTFNNSLDLDRPLPSNWIAWVTTVRTPAFLKAL